MDSTRGGVRVTQDETAQAGPPPAPARRRRGRALAALGVLGELLITLGLVLGLFVAYSLWWTNVEADAAAARAGDRLRGAWA
ncbi:class E sortase, partial [Kitasatospora sp. NPDC059973]